jgi:hypothetical protein
MTSCIDNSKPDKVTNPKTNPKPLLGEHFEMGLNSSTLNVDKFILLYDKMISEQSQYIIQIPSECKP